MYYVGRYLSLFCVSEDLKMHSCLYKCTLCVCVCICMYEKEGQKLPDIPDHLYTSWLLSSMPGRSWLLNRKMVDYFVKWIAIPLSLRAISEICKILA